MNFIILFFALLWAVAAENEAEQPPHLRTRELAYRGRGDKGHRGNWRRGRRRAYKSVGESCDDSWECWSGNCDDHTDRCEERYDVISSSDDLLSFGDHCHDDDECGSGLECDWVNGIERCVYENSRRRRGRGRWDGYGRRHGDRRGGDRRRGDQRGTSRIGDRCRNESQCPDGADCRDRHCEWRRGRRGRRGRLGDRGDDCDFDSDCRSGLECRNDRCRWE